MNKNIFFTVEDIIFDQQIKFGDKDTFFFD